MAKDEAPNSYKDPYWSSLSAKTEEQLGLPSGLLQSIVMKGERSNADQVSSAGARTPYQITPEARKLALNKYGIDPYLNPENAAEVAGRFLKESLQRNKGDAAQAVGEYHGGTDRSNWGPKTKAYINRVMVDQAQAKPQGDQATAQNQPSSGIAGGSTFERLQAQQQATKAPSISKIYDAYQSGRMTPDEAAEFEQDVNAGKLMLPRGAVLKGQQEAAGPMAKPEAITLPQGVTEAYVSGQMSPEERADLESDMRAGLVKLPPSVSSQIPGVGPEFKAPTEQGILPPAPAEPSLMDKLAGAGEAGLSALTGLVGTPLGMLGGTIGGIAGSIASGQFGTPEAQRLVEQAASEGAAGLTYAPRTATGREYLGQVGEVVAPLMAVGPMAAELAPIGESARATAPLARGVASEVIQAAKPAVARAVETVKTAPAKAVQAVAAIPGKAAEAVGLREAAPAQTGASQFASAGAAGTAPELLRTTTAENLPAPIALTKGAATRSAEQLAFEKEAMKNPELGAPLRQRAEENNLQKLQNFDKLIDATTAEAPDIAATGNAVTKAIAKDYQAAKNRTNVAYKKARDSEESQAAVDTGAKVSIGEGDNAINDSLTGYLNSKVQGVPSSGVTDSARKIMIKMGLADEDEAGNLIGKPATVGQLEEFRKELSGIAKWDDRVGLREETILKKMIDANTEPVAGPLYKQARALRTEQARKYENRAVIARLVNNVRGMDDPKVAADQVFNKSIMNSSPEEITFMKRVLQTGGEDSKQAWSELQGALLRHIKDESTKGVGTDSAGNALVSPAQLHRVVSQLDKNNRLDIVLGKQHAQVVRDLNDVVRYVNTVPPGTLINNSGSAGMLFAAVTEAGATGALTGLPVPVLSGLKYMMNHIKNVKIKAKIKDALNESPSGKPVKF